MAGRSILIIDDSPLVRDLVKQSLAGRNLDILEASNGEEAFALLKKYKPDIILLDVMMPDMDGISFMKKFNELGVYRNVLVIGLTALSEKTIVGELKALGVKDILFKPFSPAKLRVVIENYLKSKETLL
ncbi:MAG: response regulator [Synergistetes bacterium]|nr:response regulator [Synergistota bacterium]MDW8192821.1 response regulator [Synergistota bacterium]